MKEFKNKFELIDIQLQELIDFATKQHYLEEVTNKIHKLRDKNSEEFIRWSLYQMLMDNFNKKE